MCSICWLTCCLTNDVDVIVVVDVVYVVNYAYVTMTMKSFIKVDLPSQDHLVSFHLLTILTGQGHISKVVVLFQISKSSTLSLILPKYLIWKIWGAPPKRNLWLWNHSSKWICPAKITLWASTSWPSSQARVTSEKLLSSFKFLKAQLCPSYCPNILSEKYEEPLQNTTYHYEGAGQN